MRLLLFLTFILHSVQANAFWFGPDNDDYVFKKHQKYSFEQCKEFDNDDEDNDEEGMYGVECLDVMAQAHPVNKEEEIGGLLKSVKLIEKEKFETAMMEDFKNFIMAKLNYNFSLLQADNLCFREKSLPRCQKKLKTLVQTVRTEVPLMRQNLSLSNRPGVFYGQPDYENPRFLSIVDQEVKHPYNDNKIPKLDKAESQTAVRTHFQQEVDATREYLNKNTPISCQTTDENGNPKLQRDDPNCTRKHLLGVNKAVSKHRFNERQDRFKKGYNDAVSKHPYLPYLKLGPDLENKSDLQIQRDLKGAYSSLVSETGDKLNEIRQWDLDDFKDLFKYKSLINEYLTTKNPTPRYMCDISEEINDWHGEDGWWSIAGDVGIGAAALLGGGVCYFTAGIGCAIGVAIVTETVALTRSGINLSTTLSDNKSGLASIDDIDSAKTDVMFTVAFAPLSFVGFQAGKGFKHASREIASHAKNFKTSTDEVAKFLAKLPSKAKANLAKAAEVFGKTDISVVIALATHLPADMQKQFISLLKDPGAINSENFQELLNRARELSKNQCLPKGGNE